MLLYCLKCEKDTDSNNAKTARTKNGRTMLLLKFSVGDRKKSKGVKQQEASGLISNLGIKTPLKKIPSVGPPLF